MWKLFFHSLFKALANVDSRVQIWHYEDEKNTTLTPKSLFLSNHSTNWTNLSETQRRSSCINISVKQINSIITDLTCYRFLDLLQWQGFAMWDPESYTATSWSNEVCSTRWCKVDCWPCVKPEESTINNVVVIKKGTSSQETGQCRWWFTQRSIRWLTGRMN